MLINPWNLKIKTIYVLCIKFISINQRKKINLPSSLFAVFYHTKVYSSEVFPSFLSTCSCSQLVTLLIAAFFCINNCDNYKTSPSWVEGEAIVDKAICEPEVIPSYAKWPVVQWMMCNSGQQTSGDDKRIYDDIVTSCENELNNTLITAWQDYAMMLTWQECSSSGLSWRKGPQEAFYGKSDNHFSITRPPSLKMSKLHIFINHDTVFKQTHSQYEQCKWQKGIRCLDQCLL